MKFSLKFLEEFVSIDIPVSKLAELLTMAGLEIERLEKKGSDWVFEAEVTANRYDWLSVYGIAHEAAALTQKKLILSLPAVKKKKNNEIKVTLSSLSDCPFYLGSIFDNLEVKPSPAWLRRRLENLGIHSVNNVVDITNYCMLKWGQPLHAFDLQKIEGGIFVRRAKDNEKFAGIDEKERILDKRHLVIADGKKAIALAGVLGAKNTEVSHSSRTIFLEAAMFSPLAVRVTARSLAINTDSAYRFQRNVFYGNLVNAFSEAADLLQKFAGASYKGSIQAGKPPPATSKVIKFSLSDLASCLGKDIPSLRVKKILESLGFKAELKGDYFYVRRPQFRLDINIKEDVFEEVARIYGYDKIEPQFPYFKPKFKKQDFFVLKNKIKKFCALAGFREIITYSFANSQLLQKVQKDDPIVLANSLRVQENALRTTLLLGVLNTAKHNLNQQARNLRFFEIADIYKKQNKGFSEQTHLALGIAADKEQEALALKGAIAHIFAGLGKKVTFAEGKHIAFSSALEVFIQGERCGIFGEVNPQILKTAGLKKRFFYAEVDISGLQEDKLFYQPFSRFPFTYRDISIVLAKEKFSIVDQLIREEGGGLVADIELIDVYQGKNIGAGKTAVTIRIYYRAFDRTLASSEVDSLHERIRKAISRKGITLR